ncbi:YceI family protein [Alteromonas gilva]|uniref:YceI family protein n=1 Tax=Alteromonas gilva TaxID=2987522 RepID=A0ABT5L280_9ALTE|nr:YceI family protein [Alteromonas gilva]MDC8831132.1 YceI family protein [Alteromonas gilva]
MKILKGLLALVVCLHVHPVMARYAVDNTNARVDFSAEHVGMRFSGTFEKWQAQVNLPGTSDNGNGGAITASFDLSSAKTGNATYDETLPEGDWFDVKNHPQGKFASTSVTKTAQGFVVKGNLTLRGKSNAMEFTLNNQDGRLVASFPIDRLAYGIGVESDPSAEWVSQNIQMTIDIPKG